MPKLDKLDKRAHAAKVVALCLPPVAMSLIGLAALSRKNRKGDGAALARKRPAPSAGAPGRSRLG
ncbi:MAG: hypothetical protein JNM75_15365 [Rhodospirillales bacterium]|nr:hypothetical protein [Rhodospirillales bacterium]